MSSRDYFKEDDIGRTSLFYAVAENDIKKVEEIIYSLSGTGLGGQRSAAISHKDHMGLNTIDFAKKLGHDEIEKLLSVELARMEFYG
jgi:ankyrin repeat protein